ncbi:XRE family transcriptional regulator [Mycobacteroides abscessus subsp. bolletii]|nr:XRE family transcriptional regulator [Mycobacteroides abscessus subsp. bolletii]SKF74149.1 XRE family transcriptional regulator [Mycobacteroides abscessus subsp. bolletii]SKG78614.1 XRE family transcriptional regulator [Mycobacteroides abscessus subsp. bolletii]SKH19200.1 XRE family transcriptional regulator [Mycobacteroides abscessus subsp. bolletii]SKH88206.1 XRE family transcriptional regulator [Mycobacteroides abscessus subsp. bolletii]
MDSMDDQNRRMEAVLDALGPRLRALRLHRQITLVQLSETTGISESTLSRLESGQRRPTLELLLLLAEAHQVPLDELVNAPATGDPRVHPKPFKRNGSIYLPLSRRPGGIQCFKQIIPPHSPKGEPNLKVHDGYEWMYVLAGNLRLLLGELDLILPAGEAAEFDTHIPHWFGNPTDKPVEVLHIFGPQGERMHVRARSGSGN